MVTILNVIDWYKKRGNTCVMGDAVHHEKRVVLPRAIEEANENHISFIGKKLADNFRELISSTSCKILLIDQELINADGLRELESDIAFILSSDPKRDIIEFSKEYLAEKATSNRSAIHKSATVGDSVVLHSSVRLGPNVVIEDDVTIGENCTIGAGSIIKRNTTVGDNVLIGSCNVIGGDGFGYVKNKSTEQYDHFPHFGGVVLMDNVHVGNNTCIDRGSLKDTVIEAGVKIDNLVHIAHNVRIGENSLVIACAMIAGSVNIGRNSWIAPSSTIRNAITIGENSVIGLACTVTKHVRDDQTVLGSPAMPLKDFVVLRKHQKKMINQEREVQGKGN